MSRPLVQARGDASRVPAEQRQDDERDHQQDEVGFAEVRAVEARRSHDLADPDGGHDTGEHREDEDVDQRHEPALRPEPRERPVAVDGRDHRHDDRREEHEEAPEDRGMHRAGQQPLEQLALSEHDHRFVADPTWNVVVPLDRLRSTHEADEQQRAPREEGPRDGERRRERERACKRRCPYASRAFLSSAEIAGTISCRSPITA